MIVSASRRTDIPAFYGDWFMNRIKEGFACVRNTFNPTMVSKVPLTVDVVDCFVFWTKDPENLMQHLGELDRLGYKYYFQFTLTPYDKSVELGLREKSEIIKTFQELSKRIGKEKVVWRYDPILLANGIDVELHIAKFKEYVEQLADYTETVNISFLIEYKKMGKQDFRKPTSEEMRRICNEFAAIARSHGIALKACCDEAAWNNDIGKATCIDGELIKKILGQQIASNKDKGQRKECQCMESIDIGEYSSCAHFCKYCYANSGCDRIKSKMGKHDKNSPILIGYITPQDDVKERKVKSIKTGQTTLF